VLSAGIKPYLHTVSHILLQLEPAFTRLHCPVEIHAVCSVLVPAGGTTAQQKLMKKILTGTFKV